MTPQATAGLIQETSPNYDPDPADSHLDAILHRYFGYDTFRPLQREIATDALSGRDVLALLPTGAGKSLCFQLPALAADGTTIVVSPLIALMKDQVDALRLRGIPATAINSSLPFREIQLRIRNMMAGEYRLVYVAPERLMQPDFIRAIDGLNLALFAIDEAHCISQWGHDFRPEYRRLAELRDRFPNVPFMALTATATERVRSDIITQLRLRDPAIHIASFNRPNLRYWVRPKDKPFEQLRDFIRRLNGGPGIVYCHTRKMSESVAERLREHGIKALAYHAGMPPDQRQRHQDQFVHDRVQVICATIAFGMGIDKPNVRFVVHYDMPKNIEGYYQETGRAGRDGRTSWCLLLYSKGDAAKHERHADEHEDPNIRRVALKQIEEMTAFAESRGCRRRRLLAYFGERYDEPNCGGCDNCHQTTRKRPVDPAQRANVATPNGNAGADNSFNTGLFECLRALRKRVADAQGVPAYVVFHDSVLKEMARTQPRTLREIAQLKGVGPSKLEQYGPKFAAAISNYLRSHEPGPKPEAEG